MKAILLEFFEPLRGRSPFDVEWFRQNAMAKASGLVAHTACSALEQAMWDICGKLLDVPVYALMGGKVRDSLPVYANINRATARRTPEGFAASAKRAVADGFRAVKLAPFDGFNEQPNKDAFVDQGIAALFAVREAVGPAVEVMVDCHSFFTVALATQVARRLEAVKLAWYEEPVPPEQTADTVAIRGAISQQMAGGEILFGVAGFAPLCRDRAVHVIMPDVKHCGGLLEMGRIAAMAELYGVTVAPHNPSGPVATMATIQCCAGMKNFRVLELQWGEVPWRGDLVSPQETFTAGRIAVSDVAGIGVRLNDALAAKHPV